MTKIRQFDEDGVKKIAEAVTRTHVFTEHIRGEVGRIQRAAAGVPQSSLKNQIRTGITGTTPDVVTYPTNADSCIFPFHVHDLDFDVTGVDADCALTQDRKWTGIYHIGRTIDGSYVPDGTPIVFAEIPNATGKQFWILHTGEPKEHGEPRWLVMKETLLPGLKNKNAAFAVYDSGLDQWIDGGLPADQQVHDDGVQACALVDELVFGFQRPFDATNNPLLNQWDLVYNHGLQRKGKVALADIDCNDTGFLEIFRNVIGLDCDGEKAIPEVLIGFCNGGLGWHRKLHGPQTGTSQAKQDELWIGFDGYNWHAVRDTRGVLAVADASQDFCQLSSINVANIRYRDWQYTCLPTDDLIDKVDNSPHRLSGNAQSRIFLYWNEEAAALDNKDQVWSVGQVEHVVRDVLDEIVDISQSKCPKLEYKSIRITTQVSQNCGVPSPITFLEFEDEDVVARLRFDDCSFFALSINTCFPKGTVDFYQEEQLNQGEELAVAVALDRVEAGDPITSCGLQLETVVICALQVVTPGGQPVPIDFVREDTIEDVHDESDGLHQDKADHWVLCSNDPVDELILPYTDCADEGETEDIA